MARIFRVVLVGIVLYWLIYDIYADDSRTYNRNANLSWEKGHSQKSEKQPIQENSKKKKSETKRANNKNETISEIDNRRKISSDLQRLFRKILHLMELFDSNLKHTRTQNNEYIPTVDGTEPEKKSSRSDWKNENQADDKLFDENEESASKSEEKRNSKISHLKEDEADNENASCQEDGDDNKDYDVSYQEDENGKEVPYKDEDVDEDKSYREDENDNEDESNQEENDDEDESNQEENDNDEAPYQEDEYDEDESYQEDENEDDSNQEENDNNGTPYQDEDDNEGKSFQQDKDDTEDKPYQEDENDNEELSYQDEHERENKSYQDDDKLASNQEDKQNIDKNNRGNSSNKKNERPLNESAKESSKTFDNSFSVNTIVGMEKPKLENPKIIPPQNKNGETLKTTFPSAENKAHSKNIYRRTNEDLRHKSLNMIGIKTDNNKTDVVNINKTSPNTLPLHLTPPNQTDEMGYKDFGIRGSFDKNEADNETGTNQKQNQKLLYETSPLNYSSRTKPSSDISRTSRFEEVGEKREFSRATEISKNKEAPFKAGSTLQTETQDSTKFKTLLEYIYSLTNNSFFLGLKDEREEIEKR